MCKVQTNFQAFGSETNIREVKTVLKVQHLSDSVKYDIAQVQKCRAFFLNKFYGLFRLLK